MSDLISAGVGPFGNAQDPDIVPCAVCGDPVQHADKFMVEREIIHKACFICAFCDARLQVGYCVQELALYNRYGPCWYCSLICAHRPLAEKEGKLKENGVQVRTPSTRRPKAKSGQAAGINIAPAGATPTPACTPVCPPAVAEKQSENVVEIEKVAASEGEIGQAAEQGKEAGNDGPEMEAEEIEAEKVPRNAVEENGQMADVAASEDAAAPVETSKNEGAEGVGGGVVVGGGEGGGEGDGEEMEAEEVIKPAAAESAPQAEEAAQNTGAESGERAAGPNEGSEVGAKEMATDEGIPPATPTKESKPVAMDAYENKYRLQMKKKK